jgi:hypothetical protein
MKWGPERASEPPATQGPARLARAVAPSHAASGSRTRMTDRGAKGDGPPYGDVEPRAALTSARDDLKDRGCGNPAPLEGKRLRTKAPNLGPWSPPVPRLPVTYKSERLQPEPDSSLDWGEQGAGAAPAEATKRAQRKRQEHASIAATI